MDDWQLLQNYLERESETAFRTLVNRYVNLVYSVALRYVRDAQLAEEVAQAVFILLARKARGFRQGVVISGWLFRTTRFVATRAVRAEQRRQRREQEALAMQQLTTTDETWKRIAPVIDEAVESLGESDRNAVLLRFFSEKSHRETAIALGVSEDAAKKRVTRALEKLRSFFAGRGITLSAGLLASAVAANAAKAVPPEIAASISAKVIVHGSTAAGALPPLVAQTLNAWRWMKLKLAGAGVAIGTAALVLVTSALSKGPAQSGGPVIALEAASPGATSGASGQSQKPARSSATNSKRARTLRFHVVARDNGDAVPFARLAVNTVVGSDWAVRITKGCIRSCSFCAVPRLEKEFGTMRPLTEQVTNAIEQHGEKQHLVVMDNNILGIAGIEEIFGEIRDLGFQAGAKRKGRERTVDFNQGLDARLISSKPQLAKFLATVCVSPIRLAFDFVGIRPAYEQAIHLLAAEGFNEFTNYMLFNFNDTPRDLYNRLWVNANLNKELGVRVTGFPMRFIPMDDVNRRHVAAGWKWRFLRGIQCILLATRGLVSPNPDFINGAFGETFEKFLEILSMPDRYIIYRSHYANDGAADWRKEYGRLDAEQKIRLLDILAELNSSPRERPERIERLESPFRSVIEHYYPGGKTAPRTPEEDELAQQGVSVGYDSGPG